MSRAETAITIYNDALSIGLGELGMQDFHQSLLVFQPRNNLNNVTGSNIELLDQRLNNMGLQRQTTGKDGDCFFTSLAFQIVNLMTKCNENIIKHLEEKGITNQMSVEEIARRLRELVVQEWLCNEAQYHHLVGEDDDYTTEVEHLLTPGHFAASIGDSMPLAAANALNIPILLVTSVQNMPLTIVSPEVQSISKIPLVLAFTQEGAGHYDSVTTNIPMLQNLK